jgi:hypothetical protein
MKLVHAVFFGIFILILAYLGLHNSVATVAVLNSGGSQLSHETSVLQGR